VEGLTLEVRSPEKLLEDVITSLNVRVDVDCMELETVKLEEGVTVEEADTVNPRVIVPVALWETVYVCEFEAVLELEVERVAIQVDVEVVVGETNEDEVEEEEGEAALEGEEVALAVVVPVIEAVRNPEDVVDDEPLKDC